MNRIVESNLFDYALVNPSMDTVVQPDSLCIVSGYATHALASNHIQTLRARGRAINIGLIYGMAGVEGVKKIDHLGFVALHDKAEYPYDGSFDCRYVKGPKSIHAKVYVWCRKGVPVRAFAGSANYTNKGFKSAGRVEVLTECDPITAFEFYNRHLADSIPCTDTASQKVVVTSTPGSTSPTKDEENARIIKVETDSSSPFYHCKYIDIPLRNAKGHFGVGSGLNWGLDETGQPRLQNKNNPKGGRRDPNEAYIRFPKELDCGFFPPYIPIGGSQGKEAQIRFSVLTEDNELFSCIRASGGYGKEIETPQDNAELGRWFRKRLGVASGAMITDAVMRAYGRDSVRFYKLEDDQFFMDF